MCMRSVHTTDNNVIPRHKTEQCYETTHKLLIAAYMEAAL